MIVFIPLYQFIKSFLDNKMSVFEEYRAFNKMSNLKLEWPSELMKSGSLDQSAQPCSLIRPFMLPWGNKGTIKYI